MKKEAVSAPYFEHARMMRRLAGLTHFHPIHYLALVLLEETGHLAPSGAEIETIEAQIRINLAIKRPSLESNIPTECLAELPHFCPINYLAIMLLEEAGNLDPSMAEIETMEIRVKICLARVKGTFLQKKVVVFPRAKSA
jgi:hypothetical protein